VDRKTYPMNINGNMWSVYIDEQISSCECCECRDVYKIVITVPFGEDRPDWFLNTLYKGEETNG